MCLVDFNHFHEVLLPQFLQNLPQITQDQKKTLYTNFKVDRVNVILSLRKIIGLNKLSLAALFFRFIVKLLIISVILFIIDSIV